ncbi:hypothetical protein [Halorubellus litoreus]|uniref:Uncharacterized protein n=1 Tax=Halorubellus litoreus TaxID=755308 RepID=A0ABD5VED9_9EURY
MTLTINGVELEEGMNLWRYAALRTYNRTLTEQDPDDVFEEIAQVLVADYPEVVNGAPANIVKANLRGTPGVYDDSELINYHAMVATRVHHDPDTGHIDITLRDLKEQRKFVFSSNIDVAYTGEYYNSEPLSALESHLGVTILPSGGN